VCGYISRARICWEQSSILRLRACIESRYDVFFFFLFFFFFFFQNPDLVNFAQYPDLFDFTWRFVLEKFSFCLDF
jgi:hypothetical protein